MNVSARKHKILLFFLVFISSAITVSAQEGAVARAGSLIWSFFQRDAVVFFFTLVFFFALLAAIFAAAMKKVPVFGENTRQANVAAIAIAAIATLGFLFFGNAKGIRAFLEMILIPVGWFGAFALGALVFALIYFSGKEDDHSWELGVFAFGLALIFSGMLLDDPDLGGWGTVLTFIGLILLFTKTMGGNGDEHEHGEYHPSTAHGESHSPGHGEGAAPGTHGATRPGTRPDGTRDPGAGDHPEGDIDPETGQPRHPQDFTNELNTMQDLVNQYRDTLNQFRAQGDNILQTHHDHHNSMGGSGPGVDDVTDEQWSDFYAQRNELNQIGMRMTQANAALTGHPRFNTMAEPQQQAMTQMIEGWADMVRETDEYGQDMARRFAAHEGPD